MRTLAGYLLLALPLAAIGGFMSFANQKVGKPKISIFQAAQDGDMSAVRAHVETGTPLNALDSEGHTALFDAITSRHFGIAEYLIHAGANPDAELDGAETPLMAASMQGQAGLVDLMIAHGANPNRAMTNGFTPLHAAAESGNPQLVSLLIDRGADLNAPLSKFGATPICVAAWRGDTGCLKVLINAGAKLNVHAYQAATPLDLATETGKQDAIDLLKSAGAETNDELIAESRTHSNPKLAGSHL